MNTFLTELADKLADKWVTLVVAPGLLFVAAGLLTENSLAVVLRSSGQDVGKPEEEIDAIIAWAMEHPSTATLPELDRR